jgi:maltooligosyltrehalose trehalohydrolase
MRSSHAMPFGAEVEAESVRFALWAPSATAVELLCDGAVHAMGSKPDGWFELRLAAARDSSRYQFRIDGDLLVPDPAARAQPDDIKGPSRVVDPKRYVWSDAGWAGRPWTEAVVSEIHVGTATPEGTFAALTERLATLRDIGITAIELLPLADCPGTRNWGYDGVLPFAPHHAYGTPDDLKALIDRAHGLGLMVLIDVVYNHFGPAGNYLHAYAESFFTDRHKTPWGAGLNYDGKHGKAVRDFFIHNALYWIEEFHADGLRLDAVHAILDDSDTHLLAELATRVRAAFPHRHIHLVLENEKNEAHWLQRDAKGRPRFYDAQWDDDIHHCWHRLLTGESESYYGDFGGDTVARLGRGLAEGFVYQGEMSENLGHARGEPSKGLPPQAFIAFLQNHDQVGNRAAGDRLTTLAAPAELALARALLLLSPQIPMLFLGEEWGTTTPFCFFVDFADDPALSKAVREGRRKEFERFSSFGADSVPDPTALATFTASKLDWRELEKAPFNGILAETRALLALRRVEVVPLLASGLRQASYARLGVAGLQVDWSFADGSLRAVANFDAAPLALPAAAGDRVLWKSPTATGRADMIELPSWTGVVLRGAA